MNPFVSRLRGFLLVLSLVGAVHSDRAHAEPKGKPVTIGAIYNLSGSQASLGQPSFNGSTLAVEQLNARGGLLGRRVELVAVDGTTDPARNGPYGQLDRVVSTFAGTKSMRDISADDVMRLILKINPR